MGPIADTLARLIGIACGAAAADHPDAVQAGRPAEAKRHVARYLAEPDPSPAGVAASLCISVRALPLLFEPTGCGFARYMACCGLKECRAALLASPTRPVTATVFNRADLSQGRPCRAVADPQAPQRSDRHLGPAGCDRGTRLAPAAEGSGRAGRRRRLRKGSPPASARVAWMERSAIRERCRQCCLRTDPDCATLHPGYVCSLHPIALARSVGCGRRNTRFVAAGAGTLASWAEHQDRLVRLARCRLFFVGGAPRSGTTWLQSLLDSHPEVCCRGSGLFMQHLAAPLETMMAERRQAVVAKNSHLFRHTGGYPLPAPDDVEFLVGTAILQALHQQTAGKAYLAVGEKTPENVFFFPRLKRLFPGARFIGIARDPRDVLTSAWHFFHQPAAGENEAAAKTAFIGGALASLDSGARAMLALMQQFPSDCMSVTYERMREAPAPVAAQLFRFLRVSDSDTVVADCVARTSFAALSGGRPSGVAENGSFFRKGVVGDWRSTLSPAMNEMILRELGWMFPKFGWVP
jgi:hypothetical protein